MHSFCQKKPPHPTPAEEPIYHQAILTVVTLFVCMVPDLAFDLESDILWLDITFHKTRIHIPGCNNIPHARTHTHVYTHHNYDIISLDLHRASTVYKPVKKRQLGNIESVRCVLWEERSSFSGVLSMYSTYDIPRDGHL